MDSFLYSGKKSSLTLCTLLLQNHFPEATLIKWQVKDSINSAYSIFYPLRKGLSMLPRLALNLVSFGPASHVLALHTHDTALAGAQLLCCE